MHIWRGSNSFDPCQVECLTLPSPPIPSARTCIQGDSNYKERERRTGSRGAGKSNRQAAEQRYFPSPMPVAMVTVTSGPLGVEGRHVNGVARVRLCWYILPVLRKQ